MKQKDIFGYRPNDSGALILSSSFSVY